MPYSTVQVFGWPTGVGALLVRKELLQLLRKVRDGALQLLHKVRGEVLQLLHDVCCVREAGGRRQGRWGGSGHFG